MSRYSEIPQIYAAVRIQEYIGGLNIPMDLLVFVEILQPFERLSHDRGDDHLIFHSSHIILQNLCNTGCSHDRHHEPNLSSHDETDIVINDIRMLILIHDRNLFDGICLVINREWVEINHFDSYVSVFQRTFSYSSFPNNAKCSLTYRIVQCISFLWCCLLYTSPSPRD